MSPKRSQLPIGGLPIPYAESRAKKRPWLSIIALAIGLTLLVNTTHSLLAAVGIIGPMTCHAAAVVIQSAESEPAAKMEAAVFMYRDARESIRKAKDHMIQLERACRDGSKEDKDQIRHLLNELVKQIHNNREKGRYGWNYR